MRRIVVLVAMVSLCVSLPAQRISDLMKPVPAAISEEAAMPEAMQLKFSRLQKERHEKFITPETQTAPSVSDKVRTLAAAFVQPGTESFHLKYQPTDKYTVYWPELRLLNSSHGREKIKEETGKFNPKKDRLSYAVVRNAKIYIINHSHKPVDMSEFRFTSESEAIRMEGNAIQLAVPMLDIATGRYPWTYKIRCEHLSSDAQYTFDLRMEWLQETELAGQTCAFAITTIASTAANNMALLCDMINKQFHIIRLPFLIKGEGHDGKDGRRGHTGASGTNESTYKDSNGNTQRIAGTCGQPGEDGKDGEDGTDGGHFLICLSPAVTTMYGEDGVIATIDAGKGGKGGKGGQGGKHGKGSGCSGSAADGRDGKDGKDGVRGDFLYVEADVDTMILDIMKGGQK